MPLVRVSDSITAGLGVTAAAAAVTVAAAVVTVESGLLSCPRAVAAAESQRICWVEAAVTEE